MWVSVVISTIIYIVIGIFGSMAYPMTSSSNILAILARNGSTLALVTTYIFPIVVLVTSIPVFTIVIRSNLLRDWLNTLQNWSSLFFQSPVNYIVPFALYFASRRYEASVEQPPANPEKAEVDDVMMYNPEENRSISLRREPSRQMRSNLSSRLEQSRLSKRETMDSRPANSPRLEIPAIVFSSDVAGAAVRATNSPGPSPDLSFGTGTGTFAENVSTKALGISGTSSSTEQQQPIESGEKEDLRAALSCSTNHKDDKSLSPPPPSPNLCKTPPSPLSTRSSGIISNILVPRSPSVAPSLTSAVFEDIKVASLFEQEEADSRSIFEAFTKRRWLNPFVLAIVSSILVTLAVIFMIIYNVVMLALGTDLLS
ncbi:hypothetical protein DFQ28_009622 [Apophysomyces sp. BC1034]|nr:hypothetical protein DFQ30_009308 [Apophysomyces sp. BC1015]KAG0185272.1 hypothetical protein DFQ28_009622 [Apophysomyces sp. BC1034]